MRVASTARDKRAKSHGPGAGHRRGDPGYTRGRESPGHRGRRASRRQPFAPSASGRRRFRFARWRVAKTTTRASPRPASRWSTAICAISTRCAPPCKGVERIYHVAAQISTVDGQGAGALPEQRLGTKNLLAGGARGRLRPRRRHRQLQRRRPPRRRRAVRRDGAVQPVRARACPTRSRSRRSSSSACAPSPKGRTWSSPPRARSSGRTTTCRRAWARVLRDFANGKLRAYIPGGFEFVAARDIVRRPRARHAEGAHRPQVHHLVAASRRWTTSWTSWSASPARKRPRAPARVADGGHRADDAARAVDAVSVAAAAADAGRDPHPAARAPRRYVEGAARARLQADAARGRGARRPTNSSSRAARSRASASEPWADGDDDDARARPRVPRRRSIRSPRRTSSSPRCSTRPATGKPRWCGTRCCCRSG